MKIAEMKIENLRGYREQVISFNDYTCLVGHNGAGKSTILCALRIFFRDAENVTSLHNLQKEDFHCLDTSSPVKITVTFVDLSPEAQEEFKEYFRQGKLIITAMAKYDPESNSAEVKQYGQRLAMKEFSPYFAADNDGKTASYLKDRYSEIRAKFPELPDVSTKPKMQEALTKYETEHQEKCVLIPSSDQFYGFSKGTNRLAKFIQWVYIPAVKDATTEGTEGKNSALGKILARTVRSKINFAETLEILRNETKLKYQKLLNENQESLKDISDNLSKKMEDWAHPDSRLKLEWRGHPEKSIQIDEPLAQIIAGEGDFDGELSRFGHGLQRCYLLVLLQELAGFDDSKGPTLLLACEEPELHQHPPQAKHLADVLYKLSHRNSQVIVSTHSPYFVNGERFEDVRFIRKEIATKKAVVGHMTVIEFSEAIGKAKGEKPLAPEATTLKMQQALLPSLNELFFSRVAILVEGLEDIAYITTYLHLLDKWAEFRKHGCHLISADRKSNILHPAVIAKHMGIPTFIIFDSDAHTPTGKDGARIQHEKDNKAILKLRGYESQSPMPSESFWSEDLVMWKSEMGMIVAEDFGDSHLKLLEEERARFGNEKNLSKSSMFIAGLLHAAWQRGLKSSNLEKLCNCLLTYAKKH